MTASNAHNRGRGFQYRSLFWPIILIGVGVIWLLINMGSLDANHLVVAFRLWPVLLIAIGLDMIFGRRSPALGALIGITTILLFIVLMYIGPSIGLVTMPELQTQQIQYETNDAEPYTLELRSGVETLTIHPGNDANLLVDANIVYYGELTTSDTNAADRTIVIEKANNEENIFIPDWPAWMGDMGTDTNWDIALNPDVPVTMRIESGIGEINADLSQFDVRGIEAHLGIGATTMTLPAPQVPYIVTIHGGIGEVTLDLPDDVPVRVEAEAGLGSIDAAEWLTQVNDVAWESAAYADAEIAIHVDVEGGIGSINIR
jgi:predicted membrane protein